MWTMPTLWSDHTCVLTMLALMTHAFPPLMHPHKPEIARPSTPPDLVGTGQDAQTKLLFRAGVPFLCPGESPNSVFR